MKEINLSEILNKHLSTCYIVHNIKISDKYQTHLIAAMREVAEKTLELASENVTLLEDDIDIRNLPWREIELIRFRQAVCCRVKV